MHIWLKLIFTAYFFCILSISDAESNDPLCFQVSSANCSSLESKKCNKISQDSSTSQIYCCNIISEEEIKNYFNTININERKITGMHLRDSNLTRLNLEIFKKLPDLVSLSITESTIIRFDGILEDGLDDPLICLNISKNVFGESFYQHILLKLRGLKKLVMSNNVNLTILPHLPSSLVNFQLDVSGNNQLECRHLINLTLTVEDKSKEITYVNKNNTVCLPPQVNLLNNDVMLMRMDEVEKTKAIFKDCPRINENVKCDCSVYSLDSPLGKDVYVYHALVNCSNKQMTSLPRSLPLNTKILDISNNSITSLEGIGNETYNSIRELYADNNKITSLKPLEGTTFLYNFQNLTLRNNRIERIQDYMLSNVFDRNLGKIVLLAKNELVCDCNTASHTKMWLTANKAHIVDYNEVFANCESRIRVIDMDQRDLCSQPTNWKDYIRYIIVMEIVLFVLLFGKVSYDYYIFKTAGYLPWPASKMPKLPCDWCFET